MVSRREAVKRGLQVFGAGALTGCFNFGNESIGPASDVYRLIARPGIPTLLGTGGVQYFSNPDVDAMYYVPSTIDRSKPVPLVLFLHGAMRTVDFFINAFAPGAEASGVIVLAPFANSGSWDAVRYNFGPDPYRINAALQWMFDRWRIDPQRIVISGFSDGGTYSLAIGRANGDLFSRVVAYSPGFIIEIEEVGDPPILITHGRDDPVLPFEITSELLVPELIRRGYVVDFRPFDGPHAVLLSAANEVMSDLTATAQR
jgi:phospholipase/carboxylesterase